MNKKEAINKIQHFLDKADLENYEDLKEALKLGIEALSLAGTPPEELRTEILILLRNPPIIRDKNNPEYSGVNIISLADKVLSKVYPSREAVRREMAEEIIEKIESFSPNSNLPFADCNTEKGERERYLFNIGYQQAINEVVETLATPTQEVKSE